MKQFAAKLGSLALSLLAFPPVAFAEGKVVVCPPESQFKTLCELTAGKFGTALGQIVTFAFIVAIVIALAFLIYGGIKWTVSGGDKTALDEARNHIVAAIVGLVIVFLVYFILNLVVFFFTGKGLSEIEIPKLTIQ